MMTDDMIVGKTGLASFDQRAERTIVDRRGIALPAGGDLEAMREEAERAAAGIFATAAAVGVQRAGEEGDRAAERLAQPKVGPAAINLGEQADGERQITRIRAAIFFEPAFGALPGEKPCCPLAQAGVPIARLAFLHPRQAGDDQRLMIRQPAALAMAGEPAGATVQEAGDGAVAGEIGQPDRLEAGVKREGGGARGALEGIIVVAGTVAMGRG